MYGVYACNDSRIIDTNDIDRNQLGCAIGGRDRDVVAISDAIDKFAVRSVGRIGPRTRFIDTELTETIASVHVCLNNKDIGVVDIGGR